MTNPGSKRNSHRLTNKVVIPISLFVFALLFVPCVRFFYKLTMYRYGYLNLKGEAVIEAKYTGAQDFSEGLAAVYVGGTNDTGFLLGSYENDYEGGSWGYIDRNGRFVIQPRFDDAEPFYRGIAFVKTDCKKVNIAEIMQSQCREMFINKEGNEVKTISTKNQAYRYPYHDSINCKRDGNRDVDLWMPADGRIKFSIGLLGRILYFFEPDLPTNIEAAYLPPSLPNCRKTPSDG